MKIKGRKYEETNNYSASTKTIRKVRRKRVKENKKKKRIP
jgi:hypothetical protein